VKPEQWNGLIASFPEPHVLQTWQWGQVKKRFGWRPIYLIWVGKDRSVRMFAEPGINSGVATLADVNWPDHEAIDAAALVLQRDLELNRLIPSASVLYVPKGPLLRDWGDAALRKQVLMDLETLARDRGAIFIKIDPDIRLSVGEDFSSELQGKFEIKPDMPCWGPAAIEDLQKLGWLFSREQVQFRNTIVVDLRLSEDEILARMKQKTRYNIRLASRKGVEIRQATLEDLHLLYQMYAETSARDGFVIREEPYYLYLWQTFMTSKPEVLINPHAEGLIAEVGGEPIAAVIIFRFAGKAWYMFGMSRHEHRERMPNYLLQWEAMRRAKAVGCILYDLWGAPDKFDPKDAMWGVYRFKEGFGGHIVRHIGAWDYPARPSYYALYTRLLPRILDVMRWRGKARVRRLAGI